MILEIIERNKLSYYTTLIELPDLKLKKSGQLTQLLTKIQKSNINKIPIDLLDAYIENDGDHKGLHYYLYFDQFFKNWHEEEWIYDLVPYFEDGKFIWRDDNTGENYGYEIFKGKLYDLDIIIKTVYKRFKLSKPSKYIQRYPQIFKGKKK